MNDKKITYRFFLFIYLIILISPVITNCQNVLPGSDTENFKHSVGVSVGLNDFHIKDEYLSPVIFNGRMFSSIIFYQLKLEKSLHSFEFYYSQGNIDSEKQLRDAVQKTGSLSYIFLHNIYSHRMDNQILEFFLGAGISSFVTNTDFIAIDKNSGYQFYDQSWYWSHSFNMNFLGRYFLSENKSVSFRFSVPIFHLVSRPENGHHFNSGNLDVIQSFSNAAAQGESEFLWDNFSLLCGIEYRQNLTDHFDINGTYSFQYVSSGRPLTMGMYMNNYHIGIIWMF